MVDYESFEDVLQELNVDEDELKRLVSEGALRAYRDEDRMKFRKDDIEALRRANLTDLGSQPTLPVAPQRPGKPGAKPPAKGGKPGGLEVVEETDETVLDVGDLSGDADFEDTGATSVPTVDIGQAEEGDATLTEELVFEDTEDAVASSGAPDADATIAMDDGLTLGDDDLGLSTEPLGGLDADATVVDPGGGELDLGGGDLQLGGGDELSLDGGDAGGMAASPYMVAPPPPMAAPQIQIQEKIKYVEIIPSETWWTKWIFSLLIFILMGNMVLAGIGIAARDVHDTWGGLAGSLGWTIYRSGPMNENPALKQKKEFPIRPKNAEGKPFPAGSKEYYELHHWFMTADEKSSDQLFVPGQAIIRRVGDGQAPVDGEASFRKDDIRLTTTKMKEVAPTLTPEELETFRRAKLLPGYKLDDGSASVPTPPADSGTPSEGGGESSGETGGGEG